MVRRARILVVDDDESIRKVLKAVLEEEGYVVDTAADGKEAIRKSYKMFYNLALIDIRLRDMEGVKLLQKLKDTVPKMRKIMVMGYPTFRSAIEALNKADGYVVKPLDMKKLLATIKEQLKKQEEEKKYSQERVKELIETRIRELEEPKVPN